VISLLIALFFSIQPSQAPPVSSAYLPQRVYDTHRKAFTDFESMLADLARADVVFVGEQHDDPNTHGLELAVIEGLTIRQKTLVVALEMFERDAQPALDQYTSGASTEEQFLEASRPWPRYKTDYRATVEFARAHHFPIVASNVPRRIASDVSRNGLGVVDTLGTDRHLAAADLKCPTKGDYYDRFMDAMHDHGGSKTPAQPDTREKSDRFYFAQCIKDETMGESVANAVQKMTSGALAVHINGAFHSDFGDGTVESARRRLPGRRLIVVTVLPVPDLDAVHPDKQDRKRGQYLIYTLSAADPASRR
jgi:uncharacterized iron-regulated protein